MASNALLSSPMYMKRNVHRQAFTPEQEKILAGNIRNTIESGYRLVTTEIVREEARKYWEELHLHDRGTRTYRAFHASDGWIQRFKGRNGFCRMKPKMVKKIKFSQQQDVESKKLDYMCEVEEAVEKYGADCVLNMDETPAKCCEMPTSGWANRGMDNLSILTWGNEKKNVTLMPTISVSGNKLLLAWIHAAKTYKAIREMNLPPSIHSYHSPSGWINETVFIQYMTDIVKPYLGARRGALIVDDYGAHWTPAVLVAASSLGIELIHVPEHFTAELQPLDISVNGSFKLIRQQIANEERWNNISMLDNVEETVRRAAKAWQRIEKETIIRGWRKACPPLEDRL
jgi:hypothetical protein